ncbi:hypothetical protein [Rathayibacter iranicus]|uniref:Uncharacterized protein n=2 Tax=Rathayibacter iranicus TaxID=59737 RepID=A0AAD1ELM7_9MICO|nr:hypothetical protein [Rathayibacter iranicus]AZZ55257.1 hypothetical protein C7V51_04640 [Rathayibacter iranicus]MWV31498.1 hypothetical protein [Rathayibacter iranicus NCPPB 2253 = VKM Ac-1602]PPI49214.1 hypothetical protein C5E09_03715 [Rathayibacter iranicus]PPI61648.1 hypothetical protein C5E08_04625 [Rathayibacter iranicus]PPI72279.1 hypothetical protein C5E01_06000 [Rathayibacter iranicus]
MRSRSAGRRSKIGGYRVVERTPRGLVLVNEDGSEFAGRRLRPREAEAVRESPMARLPAHRHREAIVGIVPSRGRRVVVATPSTVATGEQLLAGERPLRLGAAITLLGPVIGAVRSAGAVGVHLAPTAADIGLTSEGRPVLLLTTPSVPSPRETRAALRRLLTEVSVRCAELPVTLLLEQGDLLALEGRLYGLADPEGIGLVRLSAGTTTTSVRRREHTRSSAARHRRRHPLDGWRSRVQDVAVRRRGPLLAAAVIMLGAVIAGVLGTPPSGRADHSRTPTTASPSRSPVSEPPATQAPFVGMPSSPGSAGRAQTPAEAEEAAHLLVEAALACSDADCRRALTTAESPLRTAADALAEHLPAGVGVGVVLADVNGSSAVVDLETAPGTTAASVLIIRTEAGWLIRDVYAGAAP